MSVVEPGWFPDPVGRHEFRWWDGTSWSDIVADQGAESVDRLDAHQPEAPSAEPHLQPAGLAAPSGYASGAWPQGGVDGDARLAEREPNRQMVLVAAVAVVAIVVVGAVAVVLSRDDGSSGDDTATEGDESAAMAETTAVEAVDPREALIVPADLPATWHETESLPAAPSEDLMCEPPIEPPNPPRETEIAFDRTDPPGSLFHLVAEYSPGVASDILAEHERQAGQCGTYEDVDEVAGETLRATTTPELLTGPTFGDETLWYVLHIDTQGPGGRSHDVLRVLDRHDGVISAFTLTTARPTSATDHAMIENLVRAVSDRLET